MDEVFSNEMSGICQKILSDLQFQNKQVIISITVLCINNIHIVNLVNDIKEELTCRKDHGRTKYGMATLFQIDQATFICRQ